MPRILRRCCPLLSLTLVLAACRPQPEHPAASEELAAVYALADARFQQGDLEGAAAALEARREAGGLPPPGTARLAELHRRLGNPARAVLRLREGIEQGPDAVALHLPLAELYLELGQSAPALAALQRARAGGQPEAQVAMSMGVALGRLERLDEAAAEFERARAHGAPAARVDYNLALIAGQQGRGQETRELLERAVAADPAWAPAQRELARALLKHFGDDRAQVERALDLLVAVREQLPQDWQVQEGIGDAWMRLDDVEAAITAYTEALRLGGNPPSVETRYVDARRRQLQPLEGDKPK